MMRGKSPPYEHDFISIYKLNMFFFWYPVKGVTCGSPGSVSDGEIIGSEKSSYNVGEVVEYKCNDPDIATSKERKCLSTGEWSSLNHVCTGTSEITTRNWDFHLENPHSFFHTLLFLD